MNGWRWLRYHKDRVTADRQLAWGYRRHGIQGWDRVVTNLQCERCAEREQLAVGDGPGVFQDGCLDMLGDIDSCGGGGSIGC